MVKYRNKQQIAAEYARKAYNKKVEEQMNQFIASIQDDEGALAGVQNLIKENLQSYYALATLSGSEDVALMLIEQSKVHFMETMYEDMTSKQRKE